MCQKPGPSLIETYSVPDGLSPVCSTILVCCENPRKTEIPIKLKMLGMPNKCFANPSSFHTGTRTQFNHPNRCTKQSTISVYPKSLPEASNSLENSADFNELQKFRCPSEHILCSRKFEESFGSLAFWICCWDSPSVLQFWILTTSCLQFLEFPMLCRSYYGSEFLWLTRELVPSGDQWTKEFILICF